MGWKSIQGALLERGFDPVWVDGIPGRRTLDALKAFQEHVGVPRSGAADEATLRALGLATNAVTIPPWMAILASKMGLHERRDNLELRKFLRSDGSTLGDPAVLPWCGDLVETCLALSLPTEALPTNPYLARNWAKFGDPAIAAFGCVASFWRGSPAATTGHVGFLVGHRADAFRVRGGNQSNQIGDTWIAKERLIATRRPRTYAGKLSALPLVTASGEISVNEA